MTLRAEPVGGPLVTPVTRALAGLFGLAALTIAWRLVAANVRVHDRAVVPDESV